MSSQLIFWIIILILLLDFIFGRVLDWLNSKEMSPVLPDSLKDIYNEKEYDRFQRYKKENNRVGFWSSLTGFVIMITFLSASGFGWYNGLILSITDNLILQVIIFFMGLSLISTLLDLPFDYYSTFKIEERYGFNTMTRRLYLGDFLKNLLISFVLGSALLALLVWFYSWAGSYFWLYAWGAMMLFSIFFSMFYSQLIVPLFNKQIPLESGTLRDKIESFAIKSGFRLDNIYVIDGSKRSTKANAYFTGLGPKKRVVLYDTLIKELNEEEIIAVLAHEIGHYKKRHTLQGMLFSIVQAGVLLWLFSIFVNFPALSLALGGDQAYFQLGLIAFVILYSPISTILGIFMNHWSRKNEYEADSFATASGEGESLISGLKKISVKSLSNMTPHPLYESVYYSHPSLLKRIEAIKKIEKEWKQ